MKKTKGVIYIVKGKEYVEEILTSAASLKKHMPNLSITLFTDINIESKYVDNIIKIDSSKYTFEDKVRYIGKSPYYYTLYLDSDTYVCDDFSELFDLLDKFDIAAAHGYDKGSSFTKEVPKSFASFNCGVILFKKSHKIKKLFSDWLKLYLKDKNKRLAELYPTNIIDRKHRNFLKMRKRIRDKKGTCDQISFREALYKSDVRFSILATNYNLKRKEGFVNEKVKIIHSRREMPDLIEKILNSSLSPRIYVWRDRKLNVFEAPKFNPEEDKRINEFIRTNNSRKILRFLHMFIEKLNIMK